MGFHVNLIPFPRIISFFIKYYLKKTRRYLCPNVQKDRVRIFVRLFSDCRKKVIRLMLERFSFLTHPSTDFKLMLNCHQVVVTVRSSWLLSPPVRWAELAVHSQYCQTGISTGLIIEHGECRLSSGCLQVVTTVSCHVKVLVSLWSECFIAVRKQ